MERLNCHVKEYAWGKKGNESEVARLFSAGHEQFRVGDKTSYAELWMGTHPDGPASVHNTSENLSKLIARNKNDANNNDRKDVQEIHLPFIMKVMSIEHTLSLQVHPTKEQAALLHEMDPVNYPDRNHKPELAYALTKFELLCGFRPAKELGENMKAFPELRNVMGEKNCKEFERYLAACPKSMSETKELRAALKNCFAAMLKLQVEDPKMVLDQLEGLFQRLDDNVRGSLTERTVEVMRDTYKRFPDDVGNFGFLILNHMILEPGECCFYAAEELHAYLSGECVECVGCSNNTIRAALTPKFIDRENLIKVLNYSMTDPEYYMVPPVVLENHPFVTEYAPDCKDFCLHQIQVPMDSYKEEVVELPALDCPSIIVIVEGKADCQVYSEEEKETQLNGLAKRPVQRGDIFYIPAGQSLQFTSVSKEFNRLLAYRTFSYEEGPDHSNRLIQKLPANTWSNADLKKCNVLAQKHHADDVSKTIKINKKFFKRQTGQGEVFYVENEMDGFL